MSLRVPLANRLTPAVPLLLFMLGCTVSGGPSQVSHEFAPATLQIEDLLAIDSREPGAQLVQIAQQQLGRPYRYGGKTPSGFDCSGLVYFVYREAGYAVPRTSPEQYRASRRIGRNALTPGDLLFFRVSAAKISHVGIYVADDLFIHSPSSGKGVSYASLADDYWSERLVGAGRFD